MISAIEYSEKKAAGMAIVKKVNDSYAIDFLGYNAEGVKIVIDTQAVGMDQIEAEIVTVTDQLSALNVLKADIEALV